MSSYQSTVAYTRDAGNRVTQVSDSLAGNITRSYDGLDRLVSETTPQGSIGYTYDLAGRRTGMTVNGQSAVYIKAQLQAFASSTRRNDISQQMRNIARQMTSDEINEAARYYAAQP